MLDLGEKKFLKNQDTMGTKLKRWDERFLKK